MQFRTSIHAKLWTIGVMAWALSFGCGDVIDWICANVPALCPADRRLKVNLQIDAEQESGTAGISAIVNELRSRGITATIFVTQDYANDHAVFLQQLDAWGFEIALHGKSTGEQLATMTYEEQKTRLTNAKTAVEGCIACGTGRQVKAFRPQYFSQNEDTYRVLDELGMTSNSGFKAKLSYADGHADSVWPYAMPGHNFNVVPLSTVVYNGNRIYVCDIACAQALGLNATQWGQVLTLAYQDAVANNTPLVPLFHGWYTGDSTSYTYWQPFLDFLDLLEGNVTFVTTSQLASLAD